MNLQWRPGEKVEKRVTIRNNGQTPTLVRVSLYEFFLKFAIDTSDGTGNGALKQVTKPSNTLIKMEDTTTWAKGNTYKVNGTTYFVADELIKNDTPSTAYKYNEARTNAALNYITLQLNTAAVFTKKEKPAADKKNYWYYSNGYFYYSELLQPKEISVELVQSVQ